LLYEESKNNLITAAKLLAINPDNKSSVNAGISKTYHVANRLVYVVSHGQSHASHGYAIRTHGVASALNAHGFETLCMIRMGTPWDINPNAAIPAQVQIEGVRYFHTKWPGESFESGDNPKDLSKQQRLEIQVKDLEEKLKVFKPQAVLAASNHATALPAWVAAKRLGIPFFYEVRGFWEWSQAARNKGYENTDDFALEVDLETFVAQQAQRVWTLNTQMRDELILRRVDPSSIDIVPNGLKCLIDSSAKRNIRQELGWSSNEFVLGYVGSFNTYEGLDDLLQAHAELFKAYKNIRLILVGDDPMNPNIKKGHSDGVIYIPRQRPEALSDYYSAMDIVVIPRRPERVCQLVTPIKPFEAAKNRKAMLLSNVEPLVHIARQCGAEIFNAGDVSDLVNKVSQLMAAPQQLIVLGDKARQWVESQTFENQVQTMVKVLSASAMDKR